MTIRTLTLFAALSLSVSSAVRAESTKTILDMVEMLQSAQAGPIVKHCIEQAPSIAIQVEREFKMFKDKLQIAAKPLLDRVPQEQENSIPLDVFEGMREHMTRLGQSQVERIPPSHVEAVCTSIIDNMAQTSTEDLSARMLTAYDSYIAQATSQSNK